MAECLAVERERSGIDSTAISHLLYGGKSRFERWRRIADVFEQDPAFDKSKQPFMNHGERYLLACKKAVRFKQLLQELGIAYDSEEAAWAYMAVDDVLPIDVHIKMFIPCLKYQASAQQRARWLDDALNFRILGAYAQTELGHGSNVRGIETTATFDQHAQEFVINSPTVSSTKWWPGGLGHTASHAIVYARLVVDNADHGVHAFCVQIRSTEDHRPMPGIELGDIGPKVGFHGIDNGFARFDHVRIPRDHMLMGAAEVLPDGTYLAHEGAQKLLYGAMLSVRTVIIESSAIPLAKALTIALRYSIIRRQGAVKVAAQHAHGNGKRADTATSLERPVLDYTTQQAVLLPLLAMAFASHFTGLRVRSEYQAYLQTLNVQLLPGLHAVISGLKAFMTVKIADGIEACRRVCGGHGYSQFSGLPELVNVYLAMCTVEGTREVLEPQCTRFLLRCLTDDATKIPESFQFLKRHQQLMQYRCSARNVADFLLPDDDAVFVPLFAARCVKLLRHVVDAMQLAAVNEKVAQSELLSDAGIEAGRASKAFSQLYMLQSFGDHLRAARASLSVGEAETQALQQLLQLFALHLMDEHMAEFRQDDLLSSDQARFVLSAQRSLLGSLRDQALALVESWAMSDIFLNSALARSDGDVYQALVDCASNEPLNTSPVSPAYGDLRLLLLPQPIERAKTPRLEIRSRL